MKFKKYYFWAVFLYVIAVLLHILQTYIETKKYIFENINQTLEKSIQIVPLILDDNFHHQNMLSNPISFDLDMENIRKLSQEAKIFGVKYIYTLIQDENKNEIIFTSASSTDKELETNSNLSYYGDIYDDVSPVVFDVFKNNQTLSTQYTDKWGSFYSLYIPFQSEDGTQYVIGADIDIGELDNQLTKNLIYSIVDIIFYIGILVPFFLVYRSHMRHIKNELESTIKQRTEELEIKQKQMFQQAKMASIGDMIANIAHQWRQPLSTISTTAGSLKFQDELEILQKDALYHGLDKIVKSVQYLSQTIDNFRNFFIPNKQKETKNIKELFDTIDIVFGNSLEIANIKVVKNIDDFKLDTYVNELNQVILNLIKNAADAISEKGFIFIDCLVDDKIYIKVKDSGGGIPLEIIDRIYEPYFTTKHESVGTGIGLNMSYQIITEHLKGTIIAQNVEFYYNGLELKGAEFVITLPNELLVK